MVITDLLEKLDKKSLMDTAPIKTRSMAVEINNMDTRILSKSSSTISDEVMISVNSGFKRLVKYYFYDISVTVANHWATLTRPH